MAGIIPNEGEPVWLEAMVGKTAAANTTLCLFTNNYTPIDTTVLADLTEMGAVQGYVAKTLTMASWGSAVAGTGTGTGTSNQASIAYPQQAWTFDGTGGTVTVYGYHIKSGGGKLLGAELFTTPQVVVNNGDFIKVTPTLYFGRQ